MSRCPTPLYLLKAPRGIRQAVARRLEGRRTGNLPSLGWSVTSAQQSEPDRIRWDVGIALLSADNNAPDLVVRLSNS
jgi:hypothetical protein